MSFLTARCGKHMGNPGLGWWSDLVSTRFKKNSQKGIENKTSVKPPISNTIYYKNGLVQSQEHFF